MGFKFDLPSSRRMTIPIPARPFFRGGVRFEFLSERGWQWRPANDFLGRLMDPLRTAAHDCLLSMRYSRDSLLPVGAEVQLFANLP